MQHAKLFSAQLVIVYEEFLKLALEKLPEVTDVSNLTVMSDLSRQVVCLLPDEAGLP